MSQERFRGEHHLKMDGKGRVSIPAEFRRTLQTNDPDWTEGDAPRMFIHYGAHLKGGLHVYTVRAQEEMEANVEAMDFGPDRDRAEDNFITRTQEIRLDDTGRAVLPQALRNKLNLTDGMQILARGRLTFFEMWNPDTYEELAAAREAEYMADKPANFDPRTLLNEGRRRREELAQQGRQD